MLEHLALQPRENAVHPPRSPRQRQARSGAAALELCLVLPVLCFLFVLSVDFSRIFYYDLTLANCARAGAIYASKDPASAVDTSGIQDAASKDAGNLDAKLFTVASTPDNISKPTYVTVTVTYPFKTITRYPGIPSTITLSRAIVAN